MFSMTFMIALCIGFGIVRNNALKIDPQAECVLYSKCAKLNELAQTNSNHFGTRMLFRRLSCGEKHSGKVKCISEQEINNFMEKVNLLPAENSCGIEKTINRISGGEKTELDEFPWIALLRYVNKDGKARYGCHGNLINKKYVLTAAHCIERSGEADSVGKLTKVILGEYDTSSDQDCIAVLYTKKKDCADEIKEFSIESLHVHEDFNYETRANDIALVRLKVEVIFSDYIKPICLPPDILYLVPNDDWWVGGWGETENNTMNTVKMKTIFTYKRNDDCFVTPPITEKQFCAASKGISKTCPGDSGGPIMIKRKIGDNPRTFLIGVNSMGINSCSKPIQLTVFTKVSAYVDWILQTIRK